MILEKIAESTEKRYEQIQKKIPLEAVRERALSLPENAGFPFETALKAPRLSYICEVKKASPSKGVIAENFPYLQIAKEYEKAGACAVSVLTEPEYFLGEDRYLQEISSNIRIPVLRKDFTVCTYQVYEAKLLGASAVLLICALLDTDSLREMISVCNRLGLSALVEAHDETEVQSAVKAGARIIGVNNRNLKDFTVNLNTCIRLRKQVPSDILFIGESGIKTPLDIQKLKEAGVDAVLIGETLMRSENKQKTLEELNGGAV